MHAVRTAPVSRFVFPAGIWDITGHRAHRPPLSCRVYCRFPKRIRQTDTSQAKPRMRIRTYRWWRKRSILCCAFCGAGVVFCIIGGIFSIISIVKGTGSGRVLGIVGLVLNILGLLINAVMILSIVMMIDWSKVTPENLSTINQIDTNDYNQVEQWVQQFFRMDLTTN